MNLAVHLAVPAVFEPDKFFGGWSTSAKLMTVGLLFAGACLLGVLFTSAGLRFRLLFALGLILFLGLTVWFGYEELGKFLAGEMP